MKGGSQVPTPHKQGKKNTTTLIYEYIKKTTWDIFDFNLGHYIH